MLHRVHLGINFTVKSLQRKKSKKHRNWIWSHRYGGQFVKELLVVCFVLRVTP